MLGRVHSHGLDIRVPRAVPLRIEVPACTHPPRHGPDIEDLATEFHGPCCRLAHFHPPGSTNRQDTLPGNDVLRPPPHCDCMPNSQLSLPAFRAWDSCLRP